MGTEGQQNDDGQGGDTGGNTPASDDGFKPIESQDELNRIVQERLKRAVPADLKDIKAKAAKFDELEESTKSDIQKANDKAAAAEAEVATIPAKTAEALKTHLVALHKINAEDAELFLTATDPDLLLKQVERLMGRTAEDDAARKKGGGVVPKEGKNPAAREDEDRAAVRGLFGGSDT